MVSVTHRSAVSPTSWHRRTACACRGASTSTPSLFEQAGHDEALQQVVNVAMLPGIVGASIAMPDIHWGYGFPIGGVAAMDESDGVISPGGVGFDINCGVRLVRTGLHVDEVRPRAEALMHELMRRIPQGTGVHGALRLRPGELQKLGRARHAVPDRPRPGDGRRRRAHRGGRRACRAPT